MRVELDRRHLRLVMLFLLTSFLASCGSRINQTNFDKIESEMSRADVIAILGEPTEANDVGLGGFSGGMAIWVDDGGNRISVQFLNGKVKGKQFAANPGR